MALACRLQSLDKPLNVGRDLLAALDLPQRRDERVALKLIADRYVPLLDLRLNADWP